jgi:DNA-directed RNA polymerase III subunit RPC5
MRPQFHHLDAKAQLEKARVSRDRAANESTRINEPRLVHQSAKSVVDDEELNIARTAAFLTNASEEHWIPLKYVDQEVRLLSDETDRLLTAPRLTKPMRPMVILCL